MSVPPRKGRVDLNGYTAAIELYGSCPAPQGAGGFKLPQLCPVLFLRQSRPARGGWI